MFLDHIKKYLNYYTVAWALMQLYLGGLAIYGLKNYNMPVSIIFSILSIFLYAFFVFIMRQVDKESVKEKEDVK